MGAFFVGEVVMRLGVEAMQMRVPLAEVGKRFICAKTLSKMCCLSEASSHFVVFVCVNPDRERLPSIASPQQNKKNLGHIDPSTSSGTGFVTEI